MYRRLCVSIWLIPISCNLYLCGAISCLQSRLDEGEGGGGGGGGAISSRYFMPVNRLVGLVVKASASRAEDPGFESRLRRDFSGAESYQ